jgi:phosphotransferase system HPr (HPr) family protein
MGDKTASRKVLITHQPGLHARPCLAILNTAKRFQSKVQIHYNREAADATQILQLMSLGARAGTEITITATGPDADEAVETLVRLFETDFGFDD